MTQKIIMNISFVYLCIGSKWDSKIIEGFVVPENSVYHKFSVKMLGHYNETSGGSCSGTLISPSFVLTAAHCLTLNKNTEWKNMEVSLHDPVTKKDTIFKVLNSIAHPNYGSGSKLPEINDLALLKLEAPVQNGNNFACLPNNDQDLFVGANVTITGWGLTEVIVENAVEPKISDVLKSAFFIVIPNSVCSEIFDRKINELVQQIIPGAHIPITVPHKIICADGQSTNSIACKGDSGGLISLNIIILNCLIYIILYSVSTSFQRFCAITVFLHHKRRLSVYGNNL